MSRTVLRILAVILCCGRPLAAQDPVPIDTAAVRDTTAIVIDSLPAPTVAEAASLRDRREFAAAAEMLRAVLVREPDNGDAARMLAQTLYWIGDARGAGVLYEQSMRKHPEDFTLRLDYARMLVETRADARAIEILTPLLDVAEARARAAALRGTLYYWNGDYVRAKRYFSDALAVDSTLVETKRQLWEINAASAPWIVVGVGGLHDDQPLDRFEGELEGGVYLNPLATLSAVARPMFFSTPQESSAQAVTASAGLSVWAPSARLATRLFGGVVQRFGEESSTDWTGNAALKLRLPAFASIEARVERSPYFWTIASLVTPVMMNAGTIIAGLAHPLGWTGEAAYRIEQYDDDNQVRTAYAWLLVPILRTADGSVSAGYSISRQDSDTSTFNTVYNPYYTPENILTNTVIAAVAVRPSPKATLRFHGGYGFAAREDAPTLLPSPGNSGVIAFARREFTPWNAHVAYEAALSSGSSVTVAAQSMKTAFYRATSGSVGFTYRFRQGTAH